MKALGKIIIWVFLLILAMAAPGVLAQSGNTPPSSAPPLILTDNQEQYRLGLYLETLEDPTGQLTIEDVSSPEYSSRFTPSRQKTPNFGYTRSAIWVRFRLQNKATQTDEWLLEYSHGNIHYINFYLPTLDGQTFHTIETGKLYPFESRDIPYHRFVFDIPLPPGAEQTVYLRFMNGSSIPLPLILWQPDSFAQRSRAELLLWGLFFGTLLIIAGYNLVIWLFLNERSYLYLVLFVGAMILFQLAYNGIGGQYLWPTQPWLNQTGTFFSAWFTIFSLLFASTFLQTKERLPQQHKFIVLLLVLWGLLLLQIPFVPRNLVNLQLTILGLISNLFLLIVGVSAWRKGYRSARYYLLAWAVFLVTTVIWTSAALRLLPSSAFTRQSYVFGVVWVTLFLSVALADRINIFRQEREAAYDTAVKVLQENERMVREQNILLEQQVTERTAELVKAKDQAETTNRAKSAFLANMSHELRTPLNSILGYAQIMQQYSALDPDQHHSVAVIERSGDHLLSLIDEILDLTKIEAGRLELYPSNFSLPALLEDVVAIMRVRANKKGLTLTLDATDIPAALHGDHKRLRQILLNLLSNAVKFTAEGTIILRVSDLETNNPKPVLSEAEVSKTRKLKFEIADTGPGIPADSLSTICQPFEQVRQANRYVEGAGLGLSISQTLVHTMEGELLLLSKTPTGEWATNISLPTAPPLPEQAHGTIAQFTLTLPLADVSFGLEPAQPPVRLTGVKGTPPVVLVVDNEADNRAVLVGMLTPLGFTVLEAAGGEAGLAQAGTHQPQAAIIDLRMMGLDGFEVIRRLRADESLNGMAIIAASASVLPEERQQSLVAGADSFLPKPIQTAELYQLLGELLALEWEVEPTSPSASPIVEPIDLPSPQMLDELYQLSLVGDAGLLLEFVKKLQLDYPEFAGQAQQLAERLQLNELTAWLKQLSMELADAA